MQSKFDKHGPEGFLFVVVFLLGIFAISGCIVQVEEPPVTVTTSMTQPTTTVIQSTTTVTETIMPVTLTAIGPWVGAEMEGFMTVLATFTEETCITVEYTPYRAEDLATLLPAQFAAEQSPGDLMFMWALWIKKNTEHILDLSEIIDLSEFTTVADQATIDGRVYGAPYTGKVKPGFWYRLSFFEAHGLEVPTTWEEFISLLDTIQGIDGIDAPIASGDGVGWPLTDVTEHFLLAYGGVDLFEGLKAGTVSWTSPEVTAVFEDYLVPLIADGHFSEPKEWTLILEDWWAGKHGLYFMGSWITSMVEDPNDLGVFALPGAEAFVFDGPDFFFIPKYSKHQTEVKLLAQFLAGAEGQKIQVAQGGHVATHLDVKMSDYKVGVDQQVGALLEGATTVTDLDDTIGGQFQVTVWDQLKYLWIHPEDWANVLANIEAQA